MRVTVVYPDRARDPALEPLAFVLIRSLCGDGHAVTARAVSLDETTDEFDDFSTEVLISLLPIGSLPLSTRSSVFTLAIQLGPPGEGHTRPTPLHAVLAVEGAFREGAVTVYHVPPALGISLPIWATETFELADGITQDQLMSTVIPAAAWTAFGSAMRRIEDSVAVSGVPISPFLRSSTIASNHLSVSHGRQWSGPIHAEVSSTSESIRTVRTSEHTAGYIARLVRAFDDGTRGATIQLYNRTYEAFGAHVEGIEAALSVDRTTGSLLGQRDGAVLIACACETAVWITHLRPIGIVPSPPKLSAAVTLTRAGVDVDALAPTLQPRAGQFVRQPSSWQEVVVDFRTFDAAVVLPALGPLDDSLEARSYGDVYLTHEPRTAAFVHFDFVDGFSTADQIKRLHAAIAHATRPRPGEPLVRALVLVGGAHSFSRGIDPHAVVGDTVAPAIVALGALTAWGKLIEAIVNPAKLAASGIITIASLSGPASGSGLALACACDIVLAAPTVLLDPSHVEGGLSGGVDLHTLTMPLRVGLDRFHRDQLPRRAPLTGLDALVAGYVDAVLPSAELEPFVARLLGRRVHGSDGGQIIGAPWTRLEALSGTVHALGAASLVGAMCDSKLRRFAALSRPWTAWRDDEAALLRDELMDAGALDRFVRSCAAIVHGRPLATPVELGLPDVDIVSSRTPTTTARPTTPVRRRAPSPTTTVTPSRSVTPDSTLLLSDDGETAPSSPSSSSGPQTPTKAEPDDDALDGSPARLIDALPLPPPRFALSHSSSLVSMIPRYPPLPPIPLSELEPDLDLLAIRRKSSVGGKLRRALSFHSLKMPKRNASK